MSDPNRNAGQPSGPDEEYPMAPAESEADDARPVVVPVLPEVDAESARPDQEQFQFSLAELLLLMAAVCFLLGILGPLCREPKYLAGMSGLGALVSLVVLTVLKPARAIIYVGWWAMLVIYLAACVVAVFKG